MEALDHVHLLGMRCAESIHQCSIVKSDRIHDECIAFVVSDGLAVPGWLDVIRVLIGQIDVANLIPSQNHFNSLLSLNDIHRLRQG
jgi:hypothetical protein